MAQDSMGNKELKGIVSEIEYTIDPSSRVNDVQSTDSSWGTARAGNGSLVSASNALDCGAYFSGGTYKVARAVMLFEIPGNLIRMDENPQLKVTPDTTDMTASVIVVGNQYEIGTDRDKILYGDSGVLGQTLFQNAMMASSGMMSAATGPLTKDTYNTIQLNSFATFKIMTRTVNSPYVLMSLVNYRHDMLNVAPTGGQTDGTTWSAFKFPSETGGPVLVIRKPWFVDSEGKEYPVQDDFIIRAQDVSVNQRRRRVQQLPFGSALKTAANIRQRNQSYEVTKG